MKATTHPLPVIPRTRRRFTAAFLIVWLSLLANWLWFRGDHPVVVRAEAIVFGLGFVVAVEWLYWARHCDRRHRLFLAAVASGAFVLIWQFTVFACDLLDWDAARTCLARIGTGCLFGIGLVWTVWYVEREARQFETERRRVRAGALTVSHPAQPLHATAVQQNSADRITNPFDTAAWYYGRRNPKLNQSLATLSAYAITFLLLFLIATQVGGCQELYEMPAGGGEQQAIAQTVKVQKVIRKKFIVNPFSAISFKVPPIDEVKLELTEITEHAYQVGYGEGAGAGFQGGTHRGQVRFIRLEYSGGDWDQDFGIGADVNMLIEYGIRTKQKVANRTESRTIGQLKNFPPEKSPPFVYLTGQRNVSLSNSEIKVLREYLLDRHGMIFGDNGGSGHFHNQFVGMMRRVLPNVRPTKIPLDDVIHRVPFQIPFLPYVAPHGGKDALGWRVDGRLVCYYHPGDIGDAWTDDHSGVSPEIWEACYQLGSNVIFYAHAEYSKWLASRQQNQ